MIKTNEIAYCAILGAVALLLPLVFHLFHLGHIFMPMYLPLVLLGFYVGPAAAGITSFIIPLISALATGMPPFYPPVAAVMSMELLFMSAAVSIIYTRFKTVNIWILLVPVLLSGRMINYALMYMAARMLDLPATYSAGISFFSGWPGIILMLAVIPAVLRLQHSHSRKGNRHIQ